MFLITKYLTMLMPKLHGKCTQSQFFIYSALDTDYFDEFGRGLVTSVLQNSSAGVHVHLYNPRSDQLKYCQERPRVTVTWEHVPIELFEVAAARWLAVPHDPVLLDQHNRTRTAMRKGHDASVQQRMQRTYYACARFVRLAQAHNSVVPVLAIDSDAVVRSNIPALNTAHDFYLHHIAGKKARYLAGGIYLSGTAGSHRFITQYADALAQSIDQDYLYWGVDQDLLNHIVPQYNCGQLPMSLIDWEMRDTSCIWTAKGQRKELAVFVNELKKYSA